MIDNIIVITSQKSFLDKFDIEKQNLLDELDMLRQAREKIDLENRSRDEELRQMRDRVRLSSDEIKTLENKVRVLEQQVKIFDSHCILYRRIFL